MTAPLPYRLGVDLGTSSTIAMLRWPDRRVRPLLFDGSPLLSSAVFLGPDGRLHTGRDAAHLARGNPERLEPNPKRRIDDDVVLLGDTEVAVRDLLATVLRRVAVEAGRVAGQIGELTLTHPATWGSRRCGLLVEAAERAGLGYPRLVGEPEAAATYFARTMGDAVPPGTRVLVYDLGAGTCDVTLLRRQPRGFDMIASDGLNDVGGLDVDAAIVAFLEASYGQLWNDTASRRQVWEEVRTAKEMLSRTSGTVIAIPALNKEVPLGREQFDGLIGPVLRPTIAMTKALLRDANTGADGATALVLVGGASRMPLVATLLYDALGIAPIITEQPELVVAEGALYGTPDPRDGAGTQALAGPHVAPGSGPAGGPVSAGIGPAAPISGGGGPAGPVSGGYAPVSGGYAPASGGYGPATPVSGGYGLATPVSGGHGAATPVPGGYGPPVGPTVAPPVVSGRRARLPMVIAAVAALLLVVGAGSAALVWLNKTKSGSAARDGAGSTASQSPSAHASAGKYTIGQLPENLCEKVDLGRLANTFEKEANTPAHQRNLTTVVGTSSCTVFRQHAETVSAASVTFSAFVYADTNLAVSTQKQLLENAKLNDPGLAVVNGIGDEAFVNRMPSNSATAGKDAQYAIEARDGNLRWTVYVIATRISGGAWTEQERSQLAADLQAAVRASHTRLTAG